MSNQGDVFQLDITENSDGPCLHVVTPASVLVIHTADELNDMLDKFSDPITNKVVKNTSKDRRWYVEKILPALRFYCDRFGVDKPGWLATNGHWLRMSDVEKCSLFGGGSLKYREFAPVKCADIAVVREEPEQEQQNG